MPRTLTLALSSALAFCSTLLRAPGHQRPSGPKQGLALVDAQGVIRQANDIFLTHVRQGFPDWLPPAVPSMLALPAAGLLDCRAPVLASCGAPPGAPAGYALSCGGTSFGDMCAIACATGYLGVPSSASMTCALPGWSVNPAELAGCTAVDCGALLVAYANTSDCAAHSRYGEASTVACEAGYSGSPAASCSAAGTWAVTGSCEPIACYSVPDTNGDACGDSGETCLSGACVLPAAGQLCSGPVHVELGVAQSFAVDGLHDLLAVQCASPLAPGRDLFVRATSLNQPIRRTKRPSRPALPTPKRPLSPKRKFSKTTLSMRKAESSRRKTGPILRRELSWRRRA